MMPRSQLARPALFSSARGQSLVEFAVAGPALLIFVLAIIEAAFVVNGQLALDNATREGVRTAALCGGSLNYWQDVDDPSRNWAVSNGSSPCPAAMESVIRGDLGILKVNPANPTITVTAPGPGSDPTNCPASATYSAPQGCLISVNAAYTFQFFFNFLVGPNAPSITLNSHATAVSQ